MEASQNVSIFFWDSFDKSWDIRMIHYLVRVKMAAVSFVLMDEGGLIGSNSVVFVNGLINWRETTVSCAHCLLLFASLILESGQQNWETFGYTVGNSMKRWNVFHFLLLFFPFVCDSSPSPPEGAKVCANKESCWQQIVSAQCWCQGWNKLACACMNPQ